MMSRSRADAQWCMACRKSEHPYHFRQSFHQTAMCGLRRETVSSSRRNKSVLIEAAFAQTAYA